MTHAPPGPPGVTAVVVADADGMICYWNRGAEALTGHPAAAAVGSSLDLIVPPDYRAQHWAGFRAATASGSARFEGASANIPAVLVTPAEGDPPLFDL